MTNLTKDLECKSCGYKWKFTPIKRPDPISTSCPNCLKMHRLRESKLE